MSEYVVRAGEKYVHEFRVESVWKGDSCYGVVKDVQWAKAQMFAFRWSDRNGAAGVAHDVGALVVKLVPKAKREKAPAVDGCTGHFVHDEFTACPVHDRK